MTKAVFEEHKEKLRQEMERLKDLDRMDKHTYELNPADIIDEEDLEESVADPTSALKRRNDGLLLASITKLDSLRSAKKLTEKGSAIASIKGSIVNSPEKPTVPLNRKFASN